MHDIIPIQHCQLRKVTAVKPRIVGENVPDIIPKEPCEKIANSLIPAAKHGPHRSIRKQGIIVHASYLAFGDQNMVFCGYDPKRIRIGNTAPDRHHFVFPVRFRINDCETAHTALLRVFCCSIPKKLLGGKPDRSDLQHALLNSGHMRIHRQLM